MPGCRLDDHGPVAEHVVVVDVGENDGLAFLKRVVMTRFGLGRTRDLLSRQLGKHRIAFRFLNDPGGALIVVRVCRVIEMEVRESQVRDVLRSVPNLGELLLEGSLSWYRHSRLSAPDERIRD